MSGRPATATMMSTVLSSSISPTVTVGPGPTSRPQGRRSVEAGRAVGQPEGTGPRSASCPSAATAIPDPGRPRRYRSSRCHRRRRRGRSALGAELHRKTGAYVAVGRQSVEPVVVVDEVPAVGTVEHQGAPGTRTGRGRARPHRPVGCAANPGAAIGQRPQMVGAVEPSCGGARHQAVPPCTRDVASEGGRRPVRRRPFRVEGWPNRPEGESRDGPGRRYGQQLTILGSDHDVGGTVVVVVDPLGSRRSPRPATESERPVAVSNLDARELSAAPRSEPFGRRNRYAW